MNSTNEKLDELQEEGIKTITVHPEKIEQPAPKRDYAARIEELWKRDNENTGLLNED